MKELRYQCNGIAINYMDYGNKQEPMLLLHGATNRWQSFMPIIYDLAADFRIHALDFRGHGTSERAKSYTLSDYLEDSYSFIKERIKKPVVIVGHSLGGMVGILLAAYYPEWVTQLIIIDTPLTLQSLQRFSPGSMDHAHWLIQGLRYSQLVPGLPLPEGLGQCDPEILLAMINEFDKTFELYKERELLRKIKCPLFLIRGSVELGSLISDVDLRATLKLIPHMLHNKIAHAGHSPIRQDPNSVVKLIKTFLLEKKILR
jgi:pimeloyl-ACP methyl ester carboxylesterase